MGVGGVLYSSRSLNEEVFNEATFCKVAPTNNVIWFWFMAILNGTKISVVPKNTP